MFEFFSIIPEINIKYRKCMLRREKGDITYKSEKSG